MPRLTRAKIASATGISQRTLKRHFPEWELQGKLTARTLPGKGSPSDYDEAEVMRAIEEAESAGPVLRNSPRWKAAHAHRAPVPGRNTDGPNFGTSVNPRFSRDFRMITDGQKSCTSD